MWKAQQRILQLSMMNLYSNSMKLKTATKTMQIAIGSYIPIFTLGVMYGFYDGIYKQKDHQEKLDYQRLGPFKIIA
jgi:cytochrome bd-type quinol oxidase subunit 2